MAENGTDNAVISTKQQRAILALLSTKNVAEAAARLVAPAPHQSPGSQNPFMNYRMLSPMNRATGAGASRWRADAGIETLISLILLITLIRSGSHLLVLCAFREPSGYLREYVALRVPQ